MKPTDAAHVAQRRPFPDTFPTHTMIHPTLTASLAAGFAMAALLLPNSNAATSFGDHGEEMQGKIVELVDAVVADITNETTYECTCSTGETSKEDCPTKTAPAAQFVKLLSSNGEGTLAMVQPLAINVLRSKDLDDAAVDSFLSMFLKSQNGSVAAVAEAMHDAAPKRFSPRTLLGFCELGSTTLLEPLSTLVKKGDADVASAAYLAFSGDKVGRKLLKKTASISEVSATNALDVLLAGHALQQLGDKAAVARVQGAVHAAALRALDAGELDAARQITVAAKVAMYAMRSSKPPVSQLDSQWQKMSENLSKHGELVSADQIFELLEEVTPAGITVG